MQKPLTLGIAGLGTVGVGLLQLLEDHKDRLEEQAGREVRVAGVSARSRDKKRDVDVSALPWFDDPVKMAADPDISVFVELIGGEEGATKEAVETALRSGKHVVTANKALLAKHGVALAHLAEDNGVALNFEAAVAGAIPVVATLRESLAANQVHRVYGILNGTCNYILTQMTEHRRSFEDVLKEAQEKGYAEADPTFDVDGFDTAHKLAILASLAFGTQVALDEMHVEGIRTIADSDIDAAEDMGFRIKLLGVATRTPSGIETRVHPAMVPKHSAIAEVSGVTNAVAIDADYCGNVMLVGPGAGARPTASAVAGDILDIARGTIMPPFLTHARNLKAHKKAKLGEHQGAYYVRLSVYDRPGAMAAIAKRMGDRDVSLESIVQRLPGSALPGTSVRRAPGTPTTVVLITHETTEEAIRQAIDAIESDGKVSERPQVIRIEKLHETEWGSAGRDEA